MADGTGPATGKYGYIALYGEKRHELRADTLYAAKQAADAHFKPPKSRRHLVTVHLAEMPGGETVTQVITS
jgi:hypothetical protein